ncbi:MAG: histidine kinase [Psychroflexus sp.]|nr:histidine kinase [Psychroflexus sp.]MDN6309257.1 histidine kinase [Psychroflexus sp.]
MKQAIDDQSKQDLFLAFLLEKKYRLYRHISSIVFFLLILINAKLFKEFEGSYDLYSTLALFSVMLAFFYSNMYILIPLFLDRKKYINYTLNFGLMLIVSFIAIKLYNNTFIEPHRIRTRDIELSLFSEFLYFSVLATPFILSSTALKLFQRWIQNNNKIRELENKALKSELKALKNQINPHFLFNMLNNLNVLIRSDQEKASQVTIKLSDFLRHHLYENNMPSVLLSSEVKFIEDFLGLEKIRRDHFIYQIQTDETFEKQTRIPPNIFTVFVENAIKHSVDAEQESEIVISFEKIEDQLIFKCTNTKPLYISPKKQHGVGLENVKRRLNLLYPKQHVLTMVDEKTSYYINLKLPL